MVVHDLIPALGRVRQKDCEFEASLGYTVKPYVPPIPQKYITANITSGTTLLNAVGRQSWMKERKRNIAKTLLV
jgi:hypothetical protein